MASRINLIIIASVMLAINSQCRQERKNAIKDIDGNVYSIALIGDYWWMTENLKSTRYNDGSDITCVTDQTTWFGLDSPAYCYYQNDINYVDSFGLLYNWYAVSSDKLCPTGWRVPSDEEWMQIEALADTKYDGEDSIWYTMGLRGYDAGQRLRSVEGWRKGVAGTNDLGFTALPGGEILNRFHGGGSSGFWWTSTEAMASDAYYRNLIYSYEQVSRDTHPKRMGFSVRCIKDK